jgi:hypothetical protein
MGTRIHRAPCAEVAITAVEPLLTTAAISETGALWT